MEAYKREMKALRSELDELRVDNPYYVSAGGADVDDKVDEDAVHRQQRGRDWPAADDPSKVGFTSYHKTCYGAPRSSIAHGHRNIQTSK